MPDRTDYSALIAGHTVIIEMINSGDAGLPVLNRLLRMAQPALGAAGMAFVEFAPSGGRVIAATGAAEWIVGRPVPANDPATTCLLSGPRVRCVRTDQLTNQLAVELAGRGLLQMVVSRAELGGHTVGSLHALYSADAEEPSTEERGVVAYLGTCIAHMYGDHSHLPVQGDDPTVATRADGPDLRDALDQQRHDRERDLFVAVTSHELRTPVTVIKGYADTLNDHWDSLGEADRRQAARVIGQRANELARLLDRLLSSAAEVWPGDGPPAPFDFAETLRVAVANLPADLRRRATLQVPADLPRAVGHRQSLATVLTELVTNAGKYSPPGSPIEISAAADGRTVSLQVSDRGIGIRPEHVERAFERFWQGDSGDRRRYPGTGLGLYLVRRIVEQQNGWVFLRPRTGGGTVAEMRLPCR
ncbi:MULTISPECIES: sensor histidine kinase [Micromonospora]|uniref:histidine kinase n=1 Tax=Micromonospora maris TaxID=1003110 RepID=A0A9X0I4U5_9ACTN|nr:MULTISPECIES: HAMP domain-containing sensor histidine kinase [Micromonospora]AEB47892.1 ATP-binding region ATPase domain-containing protein [Micromonospora maris AB-18-032]KUJ46893.1 PAS domain-containing sensor histidine kinase [Micromonospora maris]RUL91636.1 sensor histidine kinase [Verrucosispora sp. FIM060022]